MRANKRVPQMGLSLLPLSSKFIFPQGTFFWVWVGGWFGPITPSHVDKHIPDPTPVPLPGTTLHPCVRTPVGMHRSVPPPFACGRGPRPSRCLCFAGCPPRRHWQPTATDRAANLLQRPSQPLVPPSPFPLPPPPGPFSLCPPPPLSLCPPPSLFPLRPPPLSLSNPLPCALLLTPTLPPRPSGCVRSSARAPCGTRAVRPPRRPSGGPNARQWVAPRRANRRETPSDTHPTPRHLSPHLSPQPCMLR